MLAATYTQGAEFRVTEVPVPEAGAGEVLLRVRTASICATDLKIIRHGHRKLRDKQRIVLGHEFVGDIVEVGSGVRALQRGQRVGVAPNVGCGVCDCCIRGNANYCPEYAAFGITLDGAHAPFVKIPAEFVQQGNVVPMPEAISDREAAILEPFSCVVASLRAASIGLGDTVIIYGAGPMGLMHAALCRLSGAARVIVVDPHDQRLEKAKALGADMVLNTQKDNVKRTVTDLTNGRGADVAFIACPSPKAQEEVLGIMAPFGRLCLFAGLPNGAALVSFNTNAIHYKNLIVTGTTGGNMQDYRAALRLAAARKIRLSDFIAADFPLAEMASAYQKAQERLEGKVVMLG